MRNKKNIPDIRFKGFDEEWEENYLHEVINLKSGKDYKHLSGGNIPVYGTGGFMLNVNEALSYNCNGIGIGRKGTIDKPYILYAPFWTVDTLFYALPKDNNDLDFIFDIFQKIDWRSKDESTGVPSLSKVAINSTKICTTEFIEQQAIGNYFQNIDRLINTSQTKLDKLKNIKKACLEKMFPRNGSTTPELRFKGFTDCWKLLHLKDVSSLITKGTTPLDKSGNGDINFVKIENIDSSSGEITITTKTTEEEHNGHLKRSQLHENDILFSIAGTLGRLTIVKGTMLPANTNQALSIIRLSQGDVYYTITYLSGVAVREFVRKNPTVGAQPNLSLHQVGNLEISTPSLKEQQNIGAYFLSINNLIVLEQQQLNKLKNIKKACLDKMFVNTEDKI